jgi:hypothetical protein
MSDEIDALTKRLLEAYAAIKDLGRLRGRPDLRLAIRRTDPSMSDKVWKITDIFGWDWPASLRDAAKANPSKVLVRIWCDRHKVLVAAVFASPSGPILVTSNQMSWGSERREPGGWKPMATPVTDNPPPLYCAKCRTTRQVDGLVEATELALAQRKTELKTRLTTRRVVELHV